MPSFSDKKSLRYVITLGTGVFDVESNNRITIQGLRATADIDKAGGVQLSTLKGKIYGMSQSDMNAATSFIGQPLATGVYQYQPNTVEVYAIDGAAETLVFAGNIVNSWADYQSQPDVFFSINAMSAYYHSIKSAGPRSFKGPSDVRSIMAQISQSMGYTFEGNSVQTQMGDLALKGSDMDQARQLAQDAGIGFVIDDKVFAITETPLTPRKSLIPFLSPDTGIMGYPTFDGVGVNFNAIFNPGITFLGKMRVASDVVRANGEWVVTSIAHHLSCEMPNGPWYSSIRGNASGIVSPK